jgi:predicted lipoprotein with Yx(FWY)xxD motif
MPVYYWFKDTTNADVSGQGVGSVWYVLDASGNIVKTALPTTPAAAVAPTAMSTPAPTMAPAAAATSAPASGSPIIMAANNPSLGMILTDSKGMTLYLFTVDKPGTSNCYDQCAKNWPPLILNQGESLTAASGVSAKLGTTQRKDGTTQVTVNGMPVYYFFKDAKAGDVNGQGVGSVWFVLDSSGNAIQAAPAASPTAAPMNNSNNSYNSYNP